MKPENVKCPLCNGPMTSRKSKHGIFWGCIMYPACKGTRDSMGNSKEDRDDSMRNEEDETRWHRR